MFCYQIFNLLLVLILLCGMIFVILKKPSNSKSRTKGQICIFLTHPATCCTEIFIPPHLSYFFLRAILIKTQTVAAGSRFLWPQKTVESVTMWPTTLHPTITGHPFCQKEKKGCKAFYASSNNVQLSYSQRIFRFHTFMAISGAL